MFISQQLFLVLALLALRVKAVLVGGINVPNCAIPVIIQYGPATGCAIVPSPDIPCLCNDGSFLKNVKAGLPKSCSADQATALGNALQSRCDAVTGSATKTISEVKTSTPATTSTPLKIPTSVLRTLQPSASPTMKTGGVGTIVTSSGLISASSSLPSTRPTSSSAPLTYQSGAGGLGESKTRFAVALAVVGLIGSGTGFIFL